MMDNSEELLLYMKAAAGEFQSGSGACPDDARLIRYYRGQLTETEAEGIQAHVVGCADCRATLIDVADFFDAERPGETPVPSMDARREWKTLWGRMHPSRTPLFAWHHLPQVVLALAASLVLAVSVAGGWLLMMKQQVRSSRQVENELRSKMQATDQAHANEIAQLRAPSLNTPIFDLYSRRSRLRSAMPGERNHIRIGSEASLTLVLNGQGQPRADSYAIEISDASGKVIWQSSGLKRDPNGNFTLTLHAGFLDPGEYVVRIYAGDLADKRSIDEYPVSLEK